MVEISEEGAYYCAACNIEEEELKKEGETSLLKSSEVLSIVFGAALFIAAILLDRWFIFLASAVVSGNEIIISGVRSLIRARFRIEVLMLLASSGAFLIGHYGEGASVLLLFSIAEFLEEHASDRAKNSLRELLKIFPTTARVRRNGEEKVVHAHDLKIGEIVIVKADEKIPCDGIVVKGSSSVNEAMLTGESAPVNKEERSSVFAGTLNQEGYLEVKVEKSAEETVVAKIVKLVALARKRKSNTEKFVEKFSKYYTPSVIALAVFIGIFVPVIFSQPFEQWFYSALVLLVVSCPCALSISTPVSMVSAITSAARNGILIKGSAFLEEMSKVNAIAFDKTGTLTKGVLEVNEILPLEGRKGEVLAIAASLEALSKHPVAKAIEKETKKHAIALKTPEEFTSFPGKGVIAKIEGEKYCIGNKKWLKEEGVEISREAEQKIGMLEQEGKTVILLGREKKLIAIIALSDEIRGEAESVVKELKKRNVKAVMLSGDNEKVVSSAAQRLGIEEHYSQLLPEEKVRAIEELKRKHGKVAMVGDGINDAPALARADIGIAMGAMGSDIAIESADIALMHNELEKIEYLLDLSRKTTAIIKQNVFASISIKGSFVFLAFFGAITLWLAVGIGDMGLSLAVILNAMRLAMVK